MLTKSKPERAKMLLNQAQKEVAQRWRMYEQWAAAEYGDGDGKGTAG